MSPFRAIVLASAAAFALFWGAIFVFPSAPKSFATVTLGGTTVLAEVADNPASRALGLSGREKVAESGGMLFLFDAPGQHGIWMKGMKFPIDVIWIRDGAVVDIEESVAPSPETEDADLVVYRPDSAASAVLEVRAGFSGEYNLKIGDGVRIVRPDSQSAALASVELPGQKVTATPPQLGEKYFIETLRREKLGGKNFKIDRILAKTDAYRKVQVSYNSGKLKISGVMNIPLGKVPAGGFPVLILNHGLIHPSVYFSGRGSKREQDFFARHGYVTIHPDYRGHADSSFNPEKHHDFYVGYSEDAAALVDAIKALNSPLFDYSRIGMWGHSMGGGIATRVMVLRPQLRAYVLFAPISADAEDNFYELSKEEVGWLAKTYGVGAAASAIYQKISPLTYFADVSAPVQLHHGDADKDVPVEFSEKMYRVLTYYKKKAEFFKYPGETHEFGDSWQLAAERSLQFFDKYVKNAR